MAATDADAAAMETVRVFKYAAMVVLLVITAASALLPLWVSKPWHPNGAEPAKSEAAVRHGRACSSVPVCCIFCSDAVKLYDEVVARMDAPPHWMTTFPSVYLLCALAAPLSGAWTY
ncbi:hypothetical protein Pcac1_g17869 [Phytophthora cactorum]|nr:hypothetical protein Pcac1_g17869 [Phytophthora cactorum]